MPEVSDAVTLGGAYKESDSHVPDPTDAYGTLDTSGTAGSAHGSIESVTPIFEVAKAQEAIVAAKALDPNDDSVPASLVVLPQGMVIAEDGAQAARERVAQVGKNAAENPVEVGGLSPAQKQAAETTGEAGAAQAEGQQESAGAGSTGAVDTSRQTGETPEPVTPTPAAPVNSPTSAAAKQAARNKAGDSN